MIRKPVEYNATVTRRIELADGLAIFRVEPDAKTFTTFVPGQYIVLGLNHPEKGSVQRQYSIASPPQTLPDYFEFYVRYVRDAASDNPLTHLLFDCQEGARIHLGKKVVGRFTIDHEVGADDPRLKVFVAAGTGLAPFTSMVFDAAARGQRTDRFMVLHGASYPADLGYRGELEKMLLTDQPAPRYFPTVSRDPGQPWGYSRGRVEDFFLGDRLADLETKAGLPIGFIRPENAVVMICGLQGTIGCTILRLLGRGFVPGDQKIRQAFDLAKEVPSSLFYEQYDSSPVIDLTDAALMADCRARLQQAMAAGGA
jgi:ferredoxin--NADP+ reductase